MRAVYGKNWRTFASRLIALAGRLEGRSLSGIHCEGDAGEQLFLLDAPEAASDALALAQLVEATPLQGQVRLADGRTFSVRSQQKLESLGELALRCFREPVAPGSYWLDDTLICFETREAFGSVVEMLLTRQIDAMEYMVLEDGAFPFVLRVRDGSLYVQLYCIGEELGRVYYRVQDDGRPLNYYVPWGRSYPLLKLAHVSPPRERLYTIVRRDAAPRHLDPALFRSVYSVLVPEFAGVRAKPDTAACREMRLKIDVRLKKADPSQNRALPSVELWLLPESRIEAFTKDLYSPESALKGLDGQAFRLGTATYLALWTGGLREQGQQQPVLASLVHDDVRGLYRATGTHAPLFLPHGYILAPALQLETLRKLFGLQPGIFTVLMDGAEQACVFGLSLSEFKPVRKALVDYCLLARREKVEKLYANPLYEFDPPEVYSEPEPVAVRQEAAQSADVGSGTDSCDATQAGANGEPAASVPERGPGSVVSGGGPVPESEPDEAPGAAETDGAAPAVRRPRVRTPEELLTDKAREFIARYPRMGEDEWRRYLSAAGRVSGGQADAHAALATLLCLHPRTRVLENVSQALGLEPDWFYSRPPARLVREIFEGSWEKALPEIALFKLYAFWARTFSSPPLDSEARAHIAELKRRVFAAGNAKHIWLFSRIDYALTGDRQILDEGRIAVQNLLCGHTLDLCIPKTIRRELGKAYWKQYKSAFEAQADQFALVPRNRAWFRVLTDLYIEVSETFVLDRNRLSSTEKRLRTEAYRLAGAARTQADSALALLDGVVNCRQEHPRECGFERHFAEDTDAAVKALVGPTLIGRVAGTGKEDRLDLLLSHDEAAVRQAIERMSFPEQDYTGYLERCLTVVALLRNAGQDGYLALIREKLESWRELWWNEACRRQALEVLVLATTTSKSDTAASLLSVAMESVELLAVDIEARRQLVLLVMHCMLQWGGDVCEMCREQLGKLFGSVPLLGSEPGLALSVGELRLIYALVATTFAVLDRAPSELNTVRQHEKRAIREIVARDYRDARGSNGS